MKLSFALLTALLAPLFAGAVSVPHERRVTSLDLNPHNIQLSDPLAIAPQGDNLSNAERLRQGLTPKSPRHAHTPTRAQAARRATASAVAHTGYLKIVNAQDNSDVGLVRKSFNSLGRYVRTTNLEDALPVSFSTVPGDSSLFDLSNRNPDQSSVYPFVGFTTGPASTSSDLSRGSFNYAFLTGVQAGKNAASDNKPNSYTAATRTPLSSQSTVWKIDAAFNNFSAEWSNSDETSVPVEFVYLPSSDAIIITGDSSEITNSFGNSYKIKLVFVEVPN